ncbi:hypothetical protein DFH28DRAFT_174816 [Melampsora americana]|nr:hypothetical protein DFH28DRAFT_174816 [Melampsora americana]
MKFCQIFLSVNLLIDHQASGFLDNIPKIEYNTRPNGLAIQTSLESSGVVLSAADQQLINDREFAENMAAQAQRDRAAASWLRHRKLRQLSDMKVMTTSTRKTFEPSQAPSIPPRTAPLKVDGGSIAGKIWMAIAGMTGLAFLVGVIINIKNARSDQLTVHPEPDTTVHPEPDTTVNPEPDAPDTTET